jgi:hypothetical protein
LTNLSSSGNWHPAGTGCDSGQALLQKCSGGETDQSGAKMGIDTGKNKALSSPQTIAQWFALESR